MSVVLYCEDVDEDGIPIDNGLTIQFLYSIPLMILGLLAIMFVRIPYLPSAISLNLLLAPVGAPHPEIDKSSSFERIEYTVEPITSTSTTHVTSSAAC